MDTTAVAVRLADMYACRVCAELYLSQEEADLCAPRLLWWKRYPRRAARLATSAR